jgi:hypothetical protein
MSLIEELTERLRKGSRHARIALGAECGARVYPIYDEYWVGDFYESVRRSVDLVWSYASGSTIDEADSRACIQEVKKILDFYGDEEISILLQTVSVILYALEALTEDDAASTLAVARSLAVARDVAQSAEAMANEGVPRGSRTQWAAAWEEDWQNRALAVIDGWKGLARRDMFDVLDDKPPKWLLDWKARRRPDGALRRARPGR